MKQLRNGDVPSPGEDGLEADPAEPSEELEDPFGPRKACPVLFYSEANLLRLPWSVMDRSQVASTRRIAYRPPGAKAQWTVLAGRRGMPGPYERSVFRAWEWMALEFSVCKGKPCPNPLLFHPKEVCERLRLREREVNFAAVEDAMRRLAEVEIVDTGFLLPPPGGRFRLIADIAWHRPERAERRSLHARHALFFDGPYARSVNAGRVRPLNWELWVSLEEPVAQRLVEILDADFSRREPRVAWDYAELCQLIPIRAHRRMNGAVTLLNRAHEELVARQYLEAAEWDLRGPSPRIRYAAGSAYFAMQERLRPSGRPWPRDPRAEEAAASFWEALFAGMKRGRPHLGATM